MKFETAKIRKAIAGNLLLVLAWAGMTLSVHAATVTMDLNTVYDVAGSPVTTEDLTATFTDVSGGVDLTLSVSGLAASYYNVNTWWFNLNPTYANTLTFTPQGSPTLTPGISQGSSEAGNDGYFNLWFNGFNNNFVNGQSLTELISSSTSGLNALDFDILDSPTFTYDPDGIYYSAAQIFGGASGPSDSYYVGAETATVTYGAPDGGMTVALLGGAVTLLGIARRRMARA